MEKRTFLAWFTVGHLANDWPIASLWLIVPTVGLSMGLSPTEVGLLFTIFNLGGALAYLPAGILADHASNQGRLLVMTFWWVGVGYILAAMAPGYWSLALLLAVAGMGNAAWHPIAAGVLTRENRERRAHALGVHAIGGSLAEVLAPLSVGFLLAFVDWRGALVISALPTLLMGGCYLWVARAVPPVEKQAISWLDMRDLIHTWRRGAGLRIVVMICLYNMALMALLSMIPLYLAERYGLGPVAAGVTFSALLIAGALVQPSVGKISDIAGRRPVLVAGNLTAGFASALLIFQPSFWFTIAAMAVAVAAMDAIRATMLAAAVDHADHREGTTLGLAFALMDGVGALGSVLAGIAAGFLLAAHVRPRRRVLAWCCGIGRGDGLQAFSAGLAACSGNHTGLAQSLADALADFCEREGLLHDVQHHAVQVVGAFALVGIAGDQKNAQAGIGGGSCLGHLDAVHFGHADVGNHEVEPAAGGTDPGKARRAVAGCFDGVADALQRSCRQGPHRFVVFNNQDLCHGAILVAKS